MMSAKLATLGLLKIKVLWNKVYDVLNSVHQVANKILSMTQIILQMWSSDQHLYQRSYQIWPEKQFFWGVVLGQVQYFGTGTRHRLEISLKCDKRVKTKGKKVFGANSYVCRSYRENTGREGLFGPSVLNKVKKSFLISEAYFRSLALRRCLRYILFVSVKHSLA